MSDPFHMKGPTQIAFSGGRTSGYMLRKILDAHGGALPSGVVVTFANTGKEFPATLDFVRDVSERWGVPVRWLEYTADAPGRFLEVSHTTASRKGEPFTAMVRQERYMPNPVARLCTKNLKLKPQAAFCKSLGWTDYMAVVGLRADEPRRVAKARARIANGEDLAVPLAVAGVTKDDVMRFWASHPFDLRLPWWESNCDLCFLKPRGVLLRIAEDHPDTPQWWSNLEVETGFQFSVDRPSYAALAAQVKAQPRFNIVSDPEDAGGMDCTCTD